MGWGINEEVTNGDIIEAVIRLYPELHRVRNILGNEGHPEYGYLRHTLCNLRNILDYYEKKDT